MKERGKEALYDGRLDEALSAFEHASKLAPSRARYVVLTAIALNAQQRYALALERAQRALNMQDGDRVWQIKAAIVSGDTIRRCIEDEIKECFRQPLLTTVELERLDKAGQALVRAKQSDKALPKFLRAYAYSGQPRPLLRIATFEYVTGHYVDAREHASRIRDVEPEANSELRKEADELLRAIEADCEQKKADCAAK